MARNGPTSLPLGLMTPIVAAASRTMNRSAAMKMSPAPRMRRDPRTEHAAPPMRSACVRDPQRDDGVADQGQRQQEPYLRLVEPQRRQVQGEDDGQEAVAEHPRHSGREQEAAVTGQPAPGRYRHDGGDDLMARAASASTRPASPALAPFPPQSSRVCRILHPRAWGTAGRTSDARLPRSGLVLPGLGDGERRVVARVRKAHSHHLRARQALQTAYRRRIASKSLRRVSPAVRLYARSTSSASCPSSGSLIISRSHAEYSLRRR